MEMVSNETNIIIKLFRFHVQFESVVFILIVNGFCLSISHIFLLSSQFFHHLYNHDL